VKIRILEGRATSAMFVSGSVINAGHISGGGSAVRCNDRWGSPLRAFLQNAPEFCSQDGRTNTGQLKTTVHEPVGCFKVAKASRIHKQRDDAAA